ncbi:protein of unknown function [Cupriavidus taiwanensis]|nr:protein of unknown function [Cupriavidus taiwanensis]
MPGGIHGFSYGFTFEFQIWLKCTPLLIIEIPHIKPNNLVGRLH